MATVKKSTQGARARKRAKDAKEIADLLREGIPIRAAAEATGVHEATVRTWMRGDTEMGEMLRRARGEGIVAMHRGAAQPDGGGFRWLLSRAGIGGSYGYGDRQVIALDTEGVDESERVDSLRLAASSVALARLPAPETARLEVEVIGDDSEP